MVKKKGARDMNPADAERKKIRQKEILRNKKERQFQRDATKKRADPSAIRAELQEVIDLQDDGNNHLTIKLKKKALQSALDASVRKKRVCKSFPYVSLIFPRSTLQCCTLKLCRRVLVVHSSFLVLESASLKDYWFSVWSPWS